MSEPREFDSPWKDALDDFLEPALDLFFPELSQAVDWSKGYESLNAELAEILRDAELGPTVADRLFRVTLKTGLAVGIAIHIEIQSQYDVGLPRRMFVYHYRIGDRFQVPVVSLAILGDERNQWHPVEYESIHFGTGVRFQFRTVKLMDWAERVSALDNPLSFVVSAHLESLKTNGNPEERKMSKWRLIRMLFDKGGSPERIRKLYRLIDWFLELPVELQRSLRHDIVKYEEEHKMPYVTSDERIAREDGRIEGRIEGRNEARCENLVEMIEMAANLKFGPAGQAFADQLKVNSPSLDMLLKLKGVILKSTSIAELQAAFNE
ncbi:MAG: hypothetical protein U0798_07115 [Gemmataceae bacterium]